MNSHSRGDWRQIFAAYQQVSHSAQTGTEGPSDRLAGHLAYRIGRTFAQYDKFESEFISELLSCWSSVDGLEGDRSGFKQLYFDKRFNNFPTYASAGRRGRPKPFEAAIETVRRIVAANAIRDACRDQPVAAILGGSTSYGRFYNTKGATNDASDLDLMIILPNLDHALSAFSEELRKVPGLLSDEIDRLSSRITDLATHRRSHDHVTMSHTFNIWRDVCDPLLEGYEVPCDYKIQLHLLSYDEFKYILLNDIPALEQTRGEEERSVWDFRDDRPHRGSNTTEICFAGIPLTSQREITEVDGGYLAQELVYRIKDDRFYPGIFHNLVMPQFEVRWDRTDVNVGLLIRVFRNKILDRLVSEKQLRPWEDQSLANSHIRSRSFSPHVWRRVLNSSGDLY